MATPTAVEITGTRQREAWTAGVLPPVEKVDDGLWSIPVPIPENPLRYVLVYLLEQAGGVTLVDAGWNTEEAWRALNGGIAQTGHEVGDVKSVLVTHIHPDHYGLAGRVRQSSGAWIGLHPDDAALVPGRYGVNMDQVVGAMHALMAEHGVPATEIEDLSAASFGIRDFVDAVSPDRFINHLDKVDVPGWDVRAIHTPGHSPGHLCFYLPGSKRLLSGDHVLPRITPNIALHVQQDRNPLEEFVTSLDRVEDLDADEVLPAHEWRFRPLRQRVQEIRAHHDQRLRQAGKLVEDLQPVTCWELTERMEWSRPWAGLHGFLRRAAFGETLAHLVLLQSRGEIETTGSEPVRWKIR